MLKVNDSAPEFRLPSADGTLHSLSEHKGKIIVLYFYPKDMTPGCTDEACQFRDLHDRFIAQQAVVIGISPDPPKKHRQFTEKYQLPFLLLSDEQHSTAKAYGAWGKKKLYGKEYEGVLRTTFILDTQGRIIKIFEKVKVAGHAQEVLHALKEAT